MVLKPTTTQVEVLIWVFIYGGLLLLGVGLALQRAHDALGWSIAAIGSALALLGVVLIWLRSRMQPRDPLQPHPETRP